MTTETTEFAELTRAIEVIPRYWDQLADPGAIDSYSPLIPEAELAALRGELEDSLTPASPREITKAVAVIMGVFKIPTGTVIIDPTAFFDAMRSSFSHSGYPADAINEAIIRAHTRERWTPDTATILETAGEIVQGRRLRLYSIERMLQEHLRRQQAAAERDAEAEREAKREMDRQAELERRRQVEARARERFGDDAPLPGDLELADALIGQIKRGGVPVSWLAALARGEHWAAKYCRLMALAERVRRALVQGQVSWDDALAATKLIVIDEQTARHRIADMDRPAEYTDGHPPEAFWRTLWKINRAAGSMSPLMSSFQRITQRHCRGSIQRQAQCWPTRAQL